MKYWEECISEAFDEADISADHLQISIVASWVESAHENYGMAHGHDCIPNPVMLELDKVKKELCVEVEKVICVQCKGSGNYYDQQCWHCKGAGRRNP